MTQREAETAWRSDRLPLADCGERLGLIVLWVGARQKGDRSRPPNWSDPASGLFTANKVCRFSTSLTRPWLTSNFAAILLWISPSKCNFQIKIASLSDSRRL